RDGPGTIFVRSPAAVRRMLWAPGELGFGRAYVTGELETEGDVIGVLRALHEAGPPDMKTGARMPLLALRAAARLHATGRYGASVVGVTLSSAQADLARLRIKEAGLEEQIEIRVQDYGDVRGGAGRVLRRHLVGGHVRACRRRKDGGLFLHAPRADRRYRTTAQPCHLRHRRLPDATQVVHRALRVPRRGTDRCQPGTGCHGAGRIRGERCRVTARALRTHATGLGGEPRIELGRGRGRSGPRARASGISIRRRRPTALTMAGYRSTKCSA